jgi:hypothetical protein
VLSFRVLGVAVTLYLFLSGCDHHDPLEHLTNSSASDRSDRDTVIDQRKIVTGLDNAPLTLTVRTATPARHAALDERTEPLVYSPIPDFDLPDDVMQALHEDQDDALRAASSADIWGEWDNVLQRNNANEIGLAAAALGDTLRQSNDARVYAQIAQRLSDPMTTQAEQSGLVDVLRFAATERSVEILLELLESSSIVGNGATDTTTGVLSEAREAIAIIAQTQFDELPNWEVSPVLESSWTRLTERGTDADLRVVAQALGQLGTESGTRLLLEDACSDKLSTEDPSRVEIARTALTQITRIDAVPALQEALARDDLSAQAEETLLTALVSIDAADAGIALIEHLERLKTPSDEQIARLSAILTPAASLRQEARKVFQDALDEGEVRDPSLIKLLAGIVINVEF